MQRTAPEALLARATTIEGFERTSATMRLTAARHAAGFPGVRPEGVASDAPVAVSPSTTRASRPQPEATPRTRRTWWLAGTAAVSVVAAGATTWFGRTLPLPVESAAPTSRAAGHARDVSDARIAPPAAEQTTVRVITNDAHDAHDARDKSVDAGVDSGAKEKRGGRRGG